MLDLLSRLVPKSVLVKIQFSFVAFTLEWDVFFDVYLSQQMFACLTNSPSPPLRAREIWVAMLLKIVKKTN